MKIVKMVVTDDKGVDHTFEGTEGYCRTFTTNDGAKPPRTWKTVEAHVTLGKQ